MAVSLWSNRWSIKTQRNQIFMCVCVCIDYSGFDSGAESSILALLHAESRLWETREGVHSVALVGLRHHLRHHDRLGPSAISSSRSAWPGGDEGPVACRWGAKPSGAAETDAPQVLWGERWTTCMFSLKIVQKVWVLLPTFEPWKRLCWILSGCL